MAKKIKEFDESYFKDVFNAASIGMAIVSPDGKWLRVNEALPKIVGYTERELMKKTFQEITHPDDLETDLHFVEEMLIGKRTKYFLEKRYLHKDGHIVYVGLSVSLVRDEEGKPLFFVSQIQDLTEHRAVKEQVIQQQEQQERILDSVLSGIYIFDLKKLKNVYVNSRYTEITGLTQEDINKMGELKFLQLFHPDDRKHLRQYRKQLETAEKGETSEFKFRLKGKDGNYTWLLSRDTGFDYDEKGKLISFIGSFIEVGQQVQEEQEKNKEIKELEIVNQSMINRELRMKELKGEVDQLRKELGQKPKYTKQR
jgi:PAS domain S-box-containing protein